MGRAPAVVREAYISSCRSCCSGRPAVSSPTQLALHRARYVAAPFSLCANKGQTSVKAPPPFWLQTNKKLAGEGCCSSTISLRSFLAAEPSLFPGWAPPFLQAAPYQLPATMSRGLPPHTPHPDEAAGASYHEVLERKQE